MNPNAEAAFTPESGGFDLVAMAEGRQPEDIGAAQAVADAESTVAGVPAGGVEAQPAVESAGSEAVTFDELDARRRDAVGACGEGACASCVQRCDSYNPYESDEEFNLVDAATDTAESGRDNFDFRSAVQFKGEQARERMAQRKAAKAKEAAESGAGADKAQAETSDRPTPEQRDQIIEIRKTAADPEMVKANLERGHARMAARQAEREERLARIEVDSEATAKAAETVDEARTITARPQTPAEEPPAGAQTIAGGQTETATKNARISEVDAREHAEQIVRTQTTSAQSSEETIARTDQVAVAEHTVADKPDVEIKSIIHEQQGAHQNRMMRPEEDTASGSAQTSSAVRTHQTAESGVHNATSSHSESFRVSKTAPRHQTKIKPKSRTKTKAVAHEGDTGGERHEVQIPQTDASSETGSDTMPPRGEPIVEAVDISSDSASSPADFEADHEFSLPVPAAEQVDEVGHDATIHSASDHQIRANIETSQVSDEHIPSRPELDDTDEHDAETTPNQKPAKQNTPKKPTYHQAEETPDPESTEIADQTRTTTRPKKESPTKVSIELETDEVEEPDELDHTETDDVLTAQTIDRLIAYNQDSRRKYSGGGEIEDIWKTNPDNRGKKVVTRTSRRARSSSAATHRAKRSKKKLLKLFAALGRFVTDIFDKQQEASEGAEA